MQGDSDQGHSGNSQKSDQEKQSSKLPKESSSGSAVVLLKEAPSGSVEDLVEANVSSVEANVGSVEANAGSLEANAASVSSINSIGILGKRGREVEEEKVGLRR